MASLLTKSAIQHAAARPAQPVWLTWAWWLLRVAVEAGIVQLAFLTAYWLRFSVQPVIDDFWRPLEDFDSLRALLTVFIVGALHTKGLYRLARGAEYLDEAAGAASAVTVGFALTIVASVALRIPFDSRAVLVYSWGLTIAALLLWRAAIRVGRQHLWQRGIGVERVVVVGAGDPARRLMQALTEQQGLGYQLVGFAGDPLMSDELTIATQHRVVRAARLGTPHDLGEIVRRYGVDEVFIALPSTSHAQIMGLVATCRERAVRFRLVPDLFELSYDQVQLDEVNGVPLIGLKVGSISGWDFWVKRTVDVVLAGLGLLVAAPLLAVIALAIRLDSPGPIIFRQVRIGRGERPFLCYKFRSMYVDAEARLAGLRALNEVDGPTFKMKHDPRRTRVGRLLRRTSLDELPQLVNILRGEMSWVGPRPPVPAEVAEYEDWHRQRLQVTPGLTGLWQVCGRSNLTFDEMVLLDLYYAEHWSLWLDLKIMIRTVPAVLMARGAY